MEDLDLNYKKIVEELRSNLIKDINKYIPDGKSIDLLEGDGTEDVATIAENLENLPATVAITDSGKGVTFYHRFIKRNSFTLEVTSFNYDDGEEKTSALYYESVDTLMEILSHIMRMDKIRFVER